MKSTNKEAQDLIQELEARNQEIISRQLETGLNKQFINFMQGLNIPCLFSSQSLKEERRTEKSKIL